MIYSYIQSKYMFVLLYKILLHLIWVIFNHQKCVKIREREREREKKTATLFFRTQFVLLQLPYIKDGGAHTEGRNADTIIRKCAISE